jgi:hypothetical protein
MGTNLVLQLGLEFENLEEAWRFCVDYVGSKGFGARKSHPRKSKKDGSITSCVCLL